MDKTVKDEYYGKIVFITSFSKRYVDKNRSIS